MVKLRPKGVGEIKPRKTFPNIRRCFHFSESKARDVHATLAETNPVYSFVRVIPRTYVVVCLAVGDEPYYGCDS